MKFVLHVLEILHELNICSVFFNQRNIQIIKSYSVNRLLVQLQQIYD